MTVAKHKQRLELRTHARAQVWPERCHSRTGCWCAEEEIFDFVELRSDGLSLSQSYSGVMILHGDSSSTIDGPARVRTQPPRTEPEHQLNALSRTAARAPARTHAHLYRLHEA